MNTSRQNNRLKVKSTNRRSTDQKLDQWIKSWSNRSKLRSTDQMLDQRTKISYKFRSTDEKLDQYMKSQINRTKVRATDQNLDEKIQCQINRSKVR